MNTFINLTACSCKRNRIFLESSSLLKELLHHLQSAVGGVEGECLWGSDPATTEVLKKCQLKIDVELDSVTQMPLAVADFVRQSFRKPDEPLLILSPFFGVVSLGRIEVFLEKCELDIVSASTFSVNGNANPFWLDMIDPASRREVDGYVDVHSIVLPKLSRERSFCNITSGRAWVKYFQDNNVYGSQWLPPVEMMNQAMVFIPAGSPGELTPVFCEVPEEGDLPLLYRLPVFDFAKNEQLSFSFSPSLY